tara:strand:+ start:1708 stop:2301 length:594 start_codon:yes stop_codon:yes gene_type:complete
MQSKSLLIAIAAFAVTTTGVHAYGGTKVLQRANISEDQIAALEEAHELRKNGDADSARDILIEAGIDEEVMRSIRDAKREIKNEVREAVENNDYEAFVEAIEDGPLADIITSEADFEKFREAHELREDGQHEEAREIFDDLGIERKHKPERPDIIENLTEEQREAVRVARAANDRETVRSILEEAGVELPDRGWNRN